MADPQDRPGRSVATEQVEQVEQVEQGEQGEQVEQVELDADLPIIEFVDAMPGLPAMSRCVLVQLDEVGALYRLQSVLDPQARLLVAASPVFFNDYAPEIDDATAEGIGLTDAKDALVLLVITVGGSAAESTANLLAPIVVNSLTRKATQVLQSQADLPLQAPLIPAA